MFNGYSISFWNDEKVLEMNKGRWLHDTALLYVVLCNYMPKNGQNVNLLHIFYENKMQKICERFILHSLNLPLLVPCASTPGRYVV